MKYDIDDVITLDDGKEYYLIDKNIINGNTYYYALEYDENIDDMLDKKFCFFKVVDDYLETVTDLEIIEKLYNMFLNKYNNDNLTN